MNKPQSLREALNDAIPYLQQNPDRFHLFVDKGASVGTAAASLSWEYRYTLNVVITDFTGDQNLLMAAVMYWLRTNQPDALQNPDEREQLCTFEVDILGNGACDISINLKLTERVIAEEVNGVTEVRAVPEPGNPFETDDIWTVNRG